MNIRPKTVRRLLVLAASFLLICTGLALLLLRSWHRQKADIAALKVQAFAAFEARDYSSAVALFSNYLTRSGTQDTEPEAVYAYGISRARTPMEGNRQIVEGIGVLQHYLDLVSPADPHDASHELLKLYVQAGEKPEAHKLAARLLARHPGDVEALRYQVQSFINDHDYAAALTACRNLNKIDPPNLMWQHRELSLMAELKQPGEQIVAHARQLLERYPLDPRFNALMAVALQLNGDSAGSAKALEQAAKLPPPDADAALQVISLLDMAQQFQLADNLLAEAGARFTDSRIVQLSLQRLFEQDKFSALIERLEKLDPHSPASPAALLGYKACALY